MEDSEVDEVQGEVPDGYYVYRSGTFNVLVFLRGFYQDPKNLTPAVEHLEKTRIYPLKGESTAKPMKFPDASGVPANMLPISDASAFDSSSSGPRGRQPCRPRLARHAGGDRHR